MILTGCSKVEKTHVLEKTTTLLEIPSTTTGSDLVELNTGNIASAAKAKLEADGFTLADIKTVSFDAMQLSMVTPEDESFRFSNSIKVYLQAEGLPDTLVAWKEDGYSLTGSPLYLFRTGSDLSEYLKKDNISFKLMVQMRRVFTEPISFNFTPMFIVNAEKEK